MIYLINILKANFQQTKSLLVFPRVISSLQKWGRSGAEVGPIENIETILTILQFTIQDPVHILLLGTWSSGSTFLTKLITHYPGVFLTFEPMVFIKG